MTDLESLDFGFALIRILGNDLPPRHSETQTVDNLKFIIEKESTFDNCEKAFVLNRIVNKDLANLYKRMIEAEGFKWFEIPFIKEEFKACSSVTEEFQYLTNVNAARNFSLDVGFKELKKEICLPLDGGSFFTDEGWKGFRVLYDCNWMDSYFLIPQCRLKEYEDIFDKDFRPEIKENYVFSNSSVIALRELAIAFGPHYDLKYNENLIYGRLDKAELLIKLGVPGIWDRWEPVIRDKALESPSKYYGQCKLGGYLCRLPSGDPDGDNNSLIRGSNRMQGVRNLIKKARTI